MRCKLRFHDPHHAENDKDDGPIFPKIADVDDADVVEQKKHANRDDQAPDESPMRRSSVAASRVVIAK